MNEETKKIINDILSDFTQTLEHKKKQMVQLNDKKRKEEWDAKDYTDWAILSAEKSLIINFIWELNNISETIK